MAKRKRIRRPGFKLTKTVQGRICDAIRDGNYATVACQAAGVQDGTYQKWMARGRTEAERLEDHPDTEVVDLEKPYYDFYLAVVQARADAEMLALEAWQDHIPDSWQAARDFLARRYRDRWSNKEVVEVHQPDLSATVNEALERIYGSGDEGS